MASAAGSAPADGRASPAAPAAARAAAKRNMPKAVPQPDREAFRAQLEAGKKTIDELFRQLNALGDQSAEVAAANAQFYRRQDALRKNLDAIQRQLDSLEAERARVVAEADSAVRRNREQRMQAQQARRNLGYQSTAEIDAKLREIERLMMAHRLTTMEENKLIQQLRALRELKPQVEKAAREAAAAAGGSPTAPAEAAKKQLDHLRAETKACMQKRADLLASLAALRKQRADTQGPAREMANKKQELQQRIVAERSALNRMQDDFARQQQAFDAYTVQLQRAQADMHRVEKERQKIVSERENLERRLARLDQQAWSPELAMLTQVTHYLRGLQARIVAAKALVEGGGEVESPAAAAGGEGGGGDGGAPGSALRGLHAEEGTKIILPKKDRDDDFYFAPTPRYAKKKGKKGTVRAAEAAAAAPLVHGISTLADFQRLGVSPPYTPDEVAPVLAALEKRLAERKAAEAEAAVAMESQRAGLLAKLEAVEAEEKRMAALGRGGGGALHSAASTKHTDDDTGSEAGSPAANAAAEAPAAAAAGSGEAAD